MNLQRDVLTLGCQTGWLAEAEHESLEPSHELEEASLTRAKQAQRSRYVVWTKVELLCRHDFERRESCHKSRCDPE